MEAMLKEGLVEKLIGLQRSELGGDLIDIDEREEGEEEEEKGVSVGGVVEKGKRESRQRRFLKSHPFASCVAIVAVQLEVAESLRGWRVSERVGGGGEVGGWERRKWERRCGAHFFQNNYMSLKSLLVGFSVINYS